MTNCARLLPVPGRLFGRTALCLLAAGSLLGACTKAEDTPLANNPASAAAAPKPADGAGDPGEDFAVSDPPAPSKATGKPAGRRQAVGRSELQRHAACQSHSRQGARARRIAAGINGEAAIVVLEPDALGLLTKENCLSKEQQTERLALIKDAVRVLRQNPKTVVYIDSGHAHWDPAPVFAERLKQAGIEEANGFSVNTSNYVTTEENIAFGKKISALVGGAHFVIDTSRNGTGATPDNQWCNPPGRKIGKAPTTTTNEPLVDGFLWLKRPGESDGECNGGPKAGVFWMEKALDMAQ